MAAKEGRVAIVTGSSSGMGEAITRDLISRGWKVALADINRKESLEKDLGPNATFFKTNIADYDSHASTFQLVFKKWGRVDALCANAGITDKSSLYILSQRHNALEDVPPAPDLLCTDVDWKGIVYGTQLAIHFMRKNPTPGGKIVCTASAAALYPHESYPEYNGAKAAVLNFVRGVSRVLKIKDNICCNVVLPGIVHTNIIPQEMIDAVASDCMTPISNIVAAYNRFLDGEEYGQAVECSANEQFLVPKPEYLNGKISQRACTVWDPLFNMYHGEKSQLPDAIP